MARSVSVELKTLWSANTQRLNNAECWTLDADTKTTACESASAHSGDQRKNWVINVSKAFVIGKSASARRLAAVPASPWLLLQDNGVGKFTCNWHTQDARYEEIFQTYMRLMFPSMFFRDPVCCGQVATRTSLVQRVMEASGYRSNFSTPAGHDLQIKTQTRADFILQALNSRWSCWSTQRTPFCYIPRLELLFYLSSWKDMSPPQRGCNILYAC